MSELQPKIVKRKGPKEMRCWGYRWEKYGDCLVTLSTERKRDRFGVKQPRHSGRIRVRWEAVWVHRVFAN